MFADMMEGWIAEVARRGFPVGSSSNATKVLTLSPQLIEES